MSFRERASWAILIATVLSYAGLLVADGGSAFVMRGADLVPSSAFLASLGAFAALFFGLCAVLQLWRPCERPAPEDERERVIDLAGEKAAGGVLTAGIVGVLFVPTFHAGVPRVADVLVATFTFAQAVKEVRVIRAFRRGAA